MDTNCRGICRSFTIRWVISAASSSCWPWPFFKSFISKGAIGCEAALKLMGEIKGIHHVTAIAGPAQENLDFYAGVLGLRLVKQSVNQDDPGTYHLFYADAEGHPGTDLTFFP